MFPVHIGATGGEGGGGTGFATGTLFFNLSLSKDLAMPSKAIGSAAFCNWKINTTIYWIIVLHINRSKHALLKIKWNHSQYYLLNYWNKHIISWIVI